MMKRVIELVYKLRRIKMCGQVGANGRPALIGKLPHRRFDDCKTGMFGSAAISDIPLRFK